MRTAARHGFRRRMAALAVLALAAALSGCAGDGSAILALRSATERDAALQTRFETVLYSRDGEDHATFVLFDGPIDDPTQAVTLRLFWRPRGGRTPLDPTATNATIHYLILPGSPGPAARGARGGEVGVYSGAGFLRLRDDLGEGSLRAALRESVLRLRDRSGGFDDRLGQAKLAGTLRARRDDAGVQTLMRRLNVLASERLGYPVLVDADGPEVNGRATAAKQPRVARR